MFIHLGIYSELGGVWERKPVTSGYSEQIQSFAGIFSDWYGDCMVSGRIPSPQTDTELSNLRIRLK